MLVKYGNKNKKNSAKFWLKFIYQKEIEVKVYIEVRISEQR